MIGPQSTEVAKRLLQQNMRVLRTVSQDLEEREKRLVRMRTKLHGLENSGTLLNVRQRSATRRQ
ncbi:Hypp1051 [Branchiostoma lanceolatum]|uniref:Hypp1051 protein n=1 Tax=Branchiostoma lanceolatum TaxID=7740 RepID=A0A8J9ZG03_BRALA|nr:Hypp1051 [Branchiostoma lanceolatum]